MRTLAGLQALQMLAREIHDANPDSFESDHGLSDLLTAMALELQERADAVQAQLVLLERPDVIEALGAGFKAHQQALSESA